ncbi:MAG: CAP domain-containing protein [Nitrospirota bacterium]
MNTGHLRKEERSSRAAIAVFLLFLYGCAPVLYETTAPAKKDYGPERRVIELINEARAKGRKCGSKYYKAVQPLVWNDLLGKAALHHASDMARSGFLGHTGSDGSTPGTRLSKLGYAWSIYGENVGQGATSAEKAVQGWLESEKHCQNVMNPEFREAGAASAKSSSLRSYWTVVFGTRGR